MSQLSQFFWNHKAQLFLLQPEIQEKVKNWLPNSWLPLVSPTFLAKCRGPDDFGVHWFSEADLVLAPESKSLDEL